MKKIFFLLMAITFSFFGFKAHDTKTHPIITTLTVKEQINGRQLLKQRCFVCHSETPGYKKDMLAPPMKGVLMHYKKAYPNKKDFIKAITKWVRKPDASQSLMPGAIKKFKLMPPLPYPEIELKAIAQSLYDFQFSIPGKHKMMKRKKHSTRCGNNKCGI